MQTAPITQIQPGPEAQPICFVTSSDEKVKEVSLVFPFPLKRLNMELTEVQSTDLETVVRHKALQAWEAVQAPVFVEDTALRFMAWRSLPGPFIKHFIQNLGLLGIVDALSPAKDWRAEAITGVGYCDGGNVHYFEGRISGMVVLPAGKEVFGWDSIFRPQGSGRTYAEMSRDEKVAKSMRTVALRKLASFLASQQGAIHA